MIKSSVTAAAETYFVFRAFLGAFFVGKLDSGSVL
jgi:hypothetical protein